MTGGESVIQALSEEGVDFFFNLPGNGVYDLLEPLSKIPTIKYILGLHESTVVHMADGYSRACGKIPFVNLYMVPGTANGLSALYAAYRDKVPMVITSTQQHTSIVGREPYASAPDLLGIVRQFTKWAWEVTQPERFPEAIHRAFKVAATHPQGPVFLSFPIDLLRLPVTAPLRDPAGPGAVPSYGCLSQDLAGKIAGTLCSAASLLFVCGKEVVACDAVQEVKELAELLGAAVVSEPHTGIVAFPSPHPCSFGEYNPGILQSLQPTVIMAIGARMFVESVGPSPSLAEATKVLYLGLDPAEMGRIYPSALSCVGDLQGGLRNLLAACKKSVQPAASEARQNKIKGLKAQMDARKEDLLRTHFNNQPMSLPRLASELNKVFDRDTVIVEHATTSADLLMSYLKIPNPRYVFGTGGSCQGWGLPASIGAQLGLPNRRVVAFVGDGGFMFTPQALWTAARYQVPVTVIVLNNRGYRAMRRSVMRSCPEATRKGYDFSFDFHVDLMQLAGSFGVEATSVSSPSKIAEVVEAAMKSNRPTLVEVEISPSASVII